MARTVVSTLGKRDRELAAWFQREGFERPYLTVAALRKADIKPQTAAALLLKESGGGNNVFGHDWEAKLGRARANEDRPPYNGHNVTEARARKLRGSTYSNGVGPTQLTFKGYIDRARKAGGEWKPYVNMLIGFRIFRELFNTHGSLVLAATRYNGAEAYGYDFVRVRAEQERKLRARGFHV